VSAFLAGLLTTLGAVAAEAAAPDDKTMCGTGATFTVNLAGVRMPRDPATEGLTDRRLPADSVTLPDGCDVYAIIVHGYGRNENLDELMFYKLAKWVAEHNGYVQWSWWNNFLGEYMSRPLHVIGGASPGDNDYPTPGDVVANAWDFASGGTGKAVPDDDYQFQSDALAVLRAIRTHNPNAIVIVAGHSMGGNAVARLGSSTDVAIDLLAPIDPVGNRNFPEGQGGALGYGNGNSSAVPGADGYTEGNETFNWTRWRATHTFRGWIDRDCIRNAVGLCRDFDPRPLYVSWECRTVNSTPQDEKTSNGPLADRSCPDQYSATTLRFGPEIRRLYHRWQKEAYFPYDWAADYTFSLPSQKRTQAVPFDVSQKNYQRMLPEYNASELPLAPPVDTASKSCSLNTRDDPSGARSFEGELLKCRDWDGHGEIIGMRGTKERLIFKGTPPFPSKANLNPLALTADWQNDGWDRDSLWSPSLNANIPNCGGSACRRRHAMVEMAEPGKWRFEPRNPNLDLVVNDLVLIAADVWANRSGGGPGGPDVAAPISSATLDPAATAFGWNNTDVTVAIAAADEDGGSGVKQIAYSVSGASSGGAVVAGAALELQISAEGTTTVEFFATDNAGNAQEPQSVTVKIDKTPPVIEAKTTPPPNANGWNNTDVIVTFDASDALSGLDTVSDFVTLTDEGADQEALGVATDRAGNTATAGVIVSIDKTRPVIGGLPGSCELWPPNQQMVGVAIMVSDTLSGIETSKATAVSSEPESGPNYGNAAPDVVVGNGLIQLRAERYSKEGRRYDLSVVATDRAGNAAQGEAICRVPHDRRK
jgi:pimeloyl-ACP methyl ester carboxylesterase